eukprot:TRINITY_DN14899_c0_g1_i2.p1 TRINITY_DN14899_c0_g1~~TRINITY_DN14899_c0_g1_i2.p1  ORF type:complete len:340 (+),score=72.78 TRINITY_DN14899_c0_g1_i2:80-1099(+)
MMLEEQSDIILDQPFKAGIMKYDVITKKVQADKRKGVLKIQKFSQGNGLLTWTEVQKTEPEISIDLVPNEAELQILVQNSSKILILKRKDNPDLKFFWLQENIDNLNEVIENANTIINYLPENEEDLVQDIQLDGNNQQSSYSESNSQNQQIQQQSDQSSSQQQEMGQTLVHNLQQILQQQAHQQPNQNLQQIQQYMQQFFQTNPNSQAGQQPTIKKAVPTIRALLDVPQTIPSIANDPDYQNALIKLLPEGQQDQNGLLQNLKSPQFQQAVDQLDQALNSSEIQTILVSFGLDTNVLQKTFDGNEALYLALEKQYKQPEQPKPNEQQPKPNEQQPKKQ